MTTHEITVTTHTGKTRPTATPGPAHRHYAECSCGWNGPAYFEFEADARAEGDAHVARMERDPHDARGRFQAR